MIKIGTVEGVRVGSSTACALGDADIQSQTRQDGVEGQSPKETEAPGSQSDEDIRSRVLKESRTGTRPSKDRGGRLKGVEMGDENQ